MPLTFPNASRSWDAAAKAVAFPATDGPKQVRCLVTLDALVEHFGAARNADGDQAIRAFDRCRPVIEEQAFLKYARRRLEANGDVKLGPRDF
jgi:hypothetical protein